jgi:hypothetical protein
VREAPGEPGDLHCDCRRHGSDKGGLLHTKMLCIC